MSSGSCVAVWGKDGGMGRCGFDSSFFFVTEFDRGSGIGNLPEGGGEKGGGEMWMGWDGEVVWDVRYSTFICFSFFFIDAHSL